jgi:hypothetical protein
MRPKLMMPMRPIFPTRMHPTKLLRPIRPVWPTRLMSLIRPKRQREANVAKEATEAIVTDEAIEANQLD